MSFLSTSIQTQQ
jgi:hypothetical protein